MQRLSKFIPDNIRRQQLLIDKKKHLVLKSLPEKLSQHIHIAAIEENTITLVAENQNWANNLRYYQDQILLDLQTAEDAQIWEIKIKVLPATANGNPQRNTEPENTSGAGINIERERLRELIKRI